MNFTTRCIFGSRDEIPTLSNNACIVAEAEGQDASLPPPKIHRGIKILDNRYSGLRRDFVCLPCAEAPVVKGNEELCR